MKFDSPSPSAGRVLVLRFAHNDAFRQFNSGPCNRSGGATRANLQNSTPRFDIGPPCIDEATIEFIKRGLRALSYKFPARTAAKQAARVARNQYSCAHCGGIFGNKEILMEHIRPVGTLTTWDEHIVRLFPPLSGWQSLCRPCHLTKTNQASAVRRAA